MYHITQARAIMEERQRERQTDRQTETDRDRERQRETESLEREREREIVIQFVSELAVKSDTKLKVNTKLSEWLTGSGVN